MRVAVVGAGIVGVTTAYELAALGLEVTVFERRNSVAAEASFADAGVLSAGYVAPWTAPGLRLQLLQRLLSRPAAVRLGGWNALPHLPWLWRWWRACRPQVHAGHRAALQRLAQFSCERLLELTRLLRLDFQQMPGFLVLLRTERDLARAQPGLALLREAGVGNCRHFAHLLKAEAQRLGAGFRFDTEVRSLAPGARPTLATGDGRVHEFDAVVLCAGVQANALLASIGLKLPLAPIHGHSVTAPVRHIDGHPPPGPRAALMDEGHRVTITRLGQRIRVAGVAEVGGRLDRIDPAALRSLYRVLDDWFPGAALTRQAQHWKGAQPTLPDGAPVLGASGAPGVWLNLGHGASGWTLACGSARVLAETVAGREAPLDMSGLTAERLR